MVGAFRPFRLPLRQRHLAILLGAAICVAPLMAGGSLERPIGTIADANCAHLGNSSAVSGAQLYAGDSIQTSENGALRLRLGTGQLYLSAASYASLEEHGGLASVTLVKGSARFSLPNAIQFELETPAGILRGSGEKATSGLVAITSADELLVTASCGDLVLDNDGDLHTIMEGKSYRIVIEQERTHRPAEAHSSSSNARHLRRKLLFFQVKPTDLLA
jgi:hypothetical protein